jgi:putative transposase
MKDVVAYVTAYHGYGERRACALTRQARSTQRKPSVRDPRTAMRLRMHEIAQTRVRYGYRRVHIMLRREGWSGGRNLIYRLYREEGLVLRRRRPRRRKAAENRATRQRVQGLNEAWSLDFVHDQLSNGQSLRALTIGFSRRGKPTDNAFIESSNGTLRDECLNLHWFDDIAQAPRADRGLAAGL